MNKGPLTRTKSHMRNIQRALRDHYRRSYFLCDFGTFALTKRKMKEIIFIVEESQDGGYFARAVNHPIFTQGNTISKLKSMISDAVCCHFEATNLPNLIYLDGNHKETYAL